MKDELLRHIVHPSDDFIAVLDLDCTLVLANDTYLTAFDLPKEEILGRNFFDLWKGQKKKKNVEHQKKLIQECIHKDHVVFIEEEKVLGTRYRFKKAFYPFGRDREATHIIAVFHDISDIEAIESRLTHYEFRDHITGLFNRRSLEIILDMELEKARRSTEESFKALLFIGITNLGTVNDSIGFETGDLLLESIGCRIKETLRKSDFVFRFEGNELAVLLTTLKRMTDVAQVAEKLVEMISLPYHTGTASFNLASAIGISTYPADGATSAELIQRASAARRAAKRKGLDFLHWDPVLHTRAVERLKMKGELSRAFSGDEFILLYQPIVDAGGEIRGVEALLRWRHPSRGILTPGTFISILEENKTINTLTRWVLLQTAEQLGPVSERHGIFYSINLSSFDLLDPDLNLVVEKVLQNMHLPVRLHLELGGTARDFDWEKASDSLHNLKDQGAHLVLSDFAGANTFGALLRDLPVDGVKINIAQTGALNREPSAYALTRDLASLARNQNKRVFIEGIESEEEYAAAADIKPDFLQGYYFGEPVPRAVLLEILSTGFHLPR